TVTTQQCFQRIAAPPLNRSNTRFTRRFVSRPRPPNHCINHLGGRGRDPKLEAIKTKSGAGQLGEQGGKKKRGKGQREVRTGYMGNDKRYRPDILITQWT